MERDAESINGGHVSREDGRIRMEKDAEGMGEGLEGSVKVKVTGGEGRITGIHEGTCYCRGGNVYVLFREELWEDGGKNKTVFSSRLKIGGDQVSLRRSLPGKDGRAGTVMEFIYREQKPEEPGCFVNYPSPYGVLRLEIRTSRLLIEKRKGELHLKSCYVMLQEGNEIGKDEVKISLYAKGE